LVYLQTVETDDKGMWHNQVNIISLQKTFSIFFLAENKRLTKNCGLNANDLETSEVPYLTLFCIKTKERFVYLQIYKKSLINTLIY